ncbi:helix-turn-helix domain-containing protein [Massiliimalia timonensis]|uniref:helix-turn-helix domain-containing protein n=1 Tax=Massiliimalia timonensis TaxID=1987501 RepID=UPI000B8B3892|nr:helix-turn-helix transcriptional regulator [Massiliimalia timonensis]MBS7174880.1 helix-turn-helix transcriptional regulator [Clostridiales bacterium]
MKINQIIREKRKALSLTQEQMAELLGVSAPAVNKWEKGSTYPDITLLPALARLLKTDLNTLLSFHDDLTADEIKLFVDEVDRTVQNQSYEAAFQQAIEKIQEYPTCDNLIYSAILYLESALLLYDVPNPEHYKEKFRPYYERLADSENPGIRDTAMCMLISYARNQGDFVKAEELIHALPFSSVDKEEQLAVLYQKQKRYEDAEKLWEHRILKGVTEIESALINMLDIALSENRDSDAAFFADTYEAVNTLFYFPEWMNWHAHLQLALVQKDQKKSLEILKKMLPAMKMKWIPQACRLYQSAKNGYSTDWSSRLADTICNELAYKEDFSFLRNNTEFDKLITQMHDG